jgi:hypothetical protein
MKLADNQKSFVDMLFKEATQLDTVVLQEDLAEDILTLVHLSKKLSNVVLQDSILQDIL